MTCRLSIRSDRRPNGHCDSAPPITVALMNQATCETPRPVCTAKAGPSAQKAPLARPTVSTPATPTGDTLYRPRSDSRAEEIGAGAGERVMATGTAASDTRIEARLNRWKRIGSSASISIWPSVITEKLTVVYVVKIRPRFSSVARSFSQLSMIR